MVVNDNGFDGFMAFFEYSLRMEFHACGVGEDDTSDDDLVKGLKFFNVVGCSFEGQKMLAMAYTLLHFMALHSCQI